ncbi:MAG: phosphate ABC transporter permease subunit PstC [Fidelibacterota bacterium]|nr:MAG: phosphate ABC transporter permease subunit PstC [Candidatus Neomarinimicrobiota bacterium]
MQKLQIIQDRVARQVMFALAAFAGLIVFLMAFGLFVRSRPILESFPLFELLSSSSWHPLKGEFGLFPFLLGTLWVTGVSIVVAVPFSLLCAIHLSEYATRRICEWVKPLIDLLAGIPSVVYGICGVLIIVPLIKNHLAPLFGTFSTGYTVLAGGLVLAVMVFPIIIHVALEVFSSVPYEVREASLALGATKWQTVKLVVLRKAMPGIIAAIVLGISRAFGETMAVLMVAGNVARVPKSVFDPAYPLPALIANNYGEMMSVPLYDSALLLASLVLLLVVVFFNILSRFVLIHVEKGIQ